MTDTAPVPNLSPTECEAILEHLQKCSGEMEVAIRCGMPFGEYATAWKRERDEAATAHEPTPEVLARVLAAPIEGWGTVRDYLVELLARFWEGDANPKYGMTGESGWRYDVYGALNRVGLIPGWVQGYGIGYRTETEKCPEDRTNADSLIAAAIRTITKETT